MKRTIRTLAHRLARTAWICDSCGCHNADGHLSCGYCGD